MSNIFAVILGQSGSLSKSKSLTLDRKRETLEAAIGFTFCEGFDGKLGGVLFDAAADGSCSDMTPKQN